MRSILRSTLLAASALSLTLVLSGCEDTSKTVTPASPPAASGPADAPAGGKMEPTTPAPAPAPEKPADAPK